MENVLLGLTIAAIAIALLALLLALGVSARLREIDLEFAAQRVPDVHDIGRTGLAIGAPSPALQAIALDGAPLDDVGLRAGPTLVTFVAPACEPCAVLAESLPRFRVEHPDWSIVLFARGEDAAVREKYGALGASIGAPVVAQPDDRFAKAFESTFTPHAFVLRDGTVRARGLASGTESLEALAREAADPGAYAARPGQQDLALAGVKRP